MNSETIDPMRPIKFILENIETFYLIVGVTLTYAITITGVLIIVGKISIFSLNMIGRFFSNSWVIIDYALNRVEFKKWKDQEEKRKNCCGRCDEVYDHCINSPEYKEEQE